MKLKYNRDTELEIVLIGVFKPNAIVIIEDETEAKRYLDSGYFDEIKERKRESEYKPNILKLDVEKKIKKSKKKGVDKK